MSGPQRHRSTRRLSEQSDTIPLNVLTTDAATELETDYRPDTPDGGAGFDLHSGTGQYHQLPQTGHVHNHDDDNHEVIQAPPETLPSPTSPKRRSNATLLFYAWWWELAYLVIALLTLVALIVTLQVHNNRPLPSWPYEISLNAVVSIYTLVIKSSVGFILAEGIAHLKWAVLTRPHSLAEFAVYDEASRGPWGALRMAINPKKGKAQIVAWTGALIILAVLVLDPFTQQMVEVYSCKVLAEGKPAMVMRTAFYDEKVPVSSSLARGADETLPLGVNAAASDGLFANTKMPVQFECPTGNCTFATEYSTIGYCVACRDRTRDLRIASYHREDTGYGEAAILRVGGTSDLTLNRHQDMAMQTRFAITNHDSHVSMIRFQGEVQDEGPLYAAHTCDFKPCVKTFTAEVNGTKLEEKQLEQIDTEFGYGGDADAVNNMAYVLADLHCLDNKDKQFPVLRDLGYSFNESTRWLQYNVSAWYDRNNTELTYASLSAKDICEKLPKPNAYCIYYDNGIVDLNDDTLRTIPSRCLYQFRSATINSLNRMLAYTLFEGELKDGSNGTPVQDGPITLMAIYHAGSGTGTLADVQEIMTNMTEGVTRYIRSNGNPAFSAPAKGEAFENKSCIGVRWGWASFPALVVLLVIVFFFMMLWQSRESQMRLLSNWNTEMGSSADFSIRDFKSSVLLSLFHGMNKESLERMEGTGHANGMTELNKKAKETKVRLAPTAEGWKMDWTG